MVIKKLRMNYRFSLFSVKLKLEMKVAILERYACISFG